MAVRARDRRGVVAEAARRSRARRGDGEHLREEILDAAERLLMETGDERAVSIRAVADSVGVTAPSIYLHFPDKAALIFAVCERQFDAFDDRSERGVGGAIDPIERLERRFRAYVQFGLDNPEHYRLMFMRRSDELPDDFTTEMLQSTVSFGHLVEDVLAAMEAGQVRRDDPFKVAIELWVVVHGLTSLLIAKPDFPWPPTTELVDRLLTTLTLGLTPTTPELG